MAATWETQLRCYNHRQSVFRPAYPDQRRLYLPAEAASHTHFRLAPYKSSPSRRVPAWHQN